MDAAASGDLNTDKLRALGLALGTEQLQLEEHLAETNRLAQQHATESERRRRREQLLHRLQEEWDMLPFPERQELLREVLARVVVKDDSIETVLRP